jgi:hypothetical protein
MKNEFDTLRVTHLVEDARSMLARFRYKLSATLYKRLLADLEEIAEALDLAISELHTPETEIESHVGEVVGFEHESDKVILLVRVTREIGLKLAEVDEVTIAPVPESAPQSDEEPEATEHTPEPENGAHGATSSPLDSLPKNIPIGGRHEALAERLDAIRKLGFVVPSIGSDLPDYFSIAHREIGASRLYRLIKISGCYRRVD